MRRGPRGALLLLVLLAAPVLAGPSVQVAVLRFLPTDDGPEDAWVGTALADHLAAALASREGVVAVERERVADLLRELDLGKRGITDASAAGRLARVAAADCAVLGTFSVKDGVVRAEASLVDAATGEARTGARGTSRLPDLPELARELADQLLGPSPPGPAPRAARVPVEPLAEFYRGIAAEEQGDYPAAFVHLARAARAVDSHPDAATELGHLFRRMGEPAHAVVEWLRVGAGAAEDRAVEALLLAARTREEDEADPAGAASILADLAERFPESSEAQRAVRERARLAAAAGATEEAIRALSAAAKRLAARAASIREEFLSVPWGATTNGRKNELLDRETSLLGQRQSLVDLRRRLWIEAYLAGEPAPDPPEDVVVLNEGPDPERIEPGGVSYLRLVAPPGWAVAGIRIELSLEPGEDGRSLETGVGLGPWGVFTPETWRVLPPVTAPVQKTLEFDLPHPARMAVLQVPPDHWRAQVRLGPAPEDPARIVAGGIDGVAQQARVSRDRSRRVHVVFSAGSMGFALGRAVSRSVPDDSGYAGLFLATSEDDGATFGPARRLAVSSGRRDLSPFLTQGRDGRHHLTWVSNRADPSAATVWYSASDDLVRWSFPRMIPVPFVPLPEMFADLDHGVGWGPRIVETPDRRLHLLVSATFGPEGPGIYRMVSPDGVTWSGAALVAPGEREFSVVGRPDGSFLLASRARGERTVLLESARGERWTEVPRSDPGDLPHSGRLDPPVLALTPGGEVLLAEGFTGSELDLTRFPAEGSARTRRVEFEAGRVGGILPRADGTVLVVFTPWRTDLAGAVLSRVVEVPK